MVKITIHNIKIATGIQCCLLNEILPIQGREYSSLNYPQISFGAINIQSFQDCFCNPNPQRGLM